MPRGAVGQRLSLASTPALPAASGCSEWAWPTVGQQHLGEHTVERLLDLATLPRAAPARSLVSFQLDPGLVCSTERLLIRLLQDERLVAVEPELTQPLHRGLLLEHLNHLHNHLSHTKWRHRKAMH